MMFLTFLVVPEQLKVAKIVRSFQQNTKCYRRQTALGRIHRDKSFVLLSEMGLPTPLTHEAAGESGVTTSRKALIFPQGSSLTVNLAWCSRPSGAAVFA